MNILFVDDQKSVCRFLKKEVNWKELPVDQVYTATSAKEAKLIMINFSVDLLVTDIEMPEENGLSLAEWARDNVKDIIIVLLTSYANFEYAQKAIKLQVFQYILQPVKISAVEEMIVSANKKLLARKKTLKPQTYNLSMWDSMLDSMLIKCREKQAKDATQYYQRIKEIVEVPSAVQTYMALFRFRKFMVLGQEWEDTRIRFVFRNVLQEIFEEECKVLVSNVRPGNYWVMLLFDSEKDRSEKICAGFEFFRNFLSEHTETNVSVFFKSTPVEAAISEYTDSLMYYSEEKSTSQCACYQVDKRESSDLEGCEGCLAKAIEYIDNHLEENPSRTEVADYVHINPDYLSRIFHEHTGMTFKDYILQKRMDKAKYLLKNTQFSGGVIAMKLGYESFSHFTSSFKKYTGITPMEYRKIDL